jgi:hypothetical protein
MRIGLNHGLAVNLNTLNNGVALVNHTNPSKPRPKDMQPFLCVKIIIKHEQISMKPKSVIYRSKPNLHKNPSSNLRFVYE